MDGRSYTSGNYRFGFNGKENDVETQTQDYGFRIYNPRLAKFLSVDPLTKDYPELTPYQFASNRPVQCVDLDGLEAYFKNSGEFVKWGPDKSTSAPVIVMTDKTNIQIQLNYTQMLDRAHWGFGEGRGEFADDFAHTMQNSKDWGFHGEGFTEDGMYFNMQDDKYKGKAEFFSGKTGYHNYDDFTEARKDPNKLNTLDGARKNISAVLKQQIGESNDETNNATEWRGYAKGSAKAINSYNSRVKKYGAEKVTKRDSKTRSHIFTDSRSKTDIANKAKKDAKNKKIIIPKVKHI